jgi:hypothetical protein
VYEIGVSDYSALFHDAICVLCNFFARASFHYDIGGHSFAMVLKRMQEKAENETKKQEESNEPE